MRAIDTNLVVRYPTGDHPEQSGPGRAEIEAGPVFANTTVVLETEWVLRSAYGYPGGAVVTALRPFAGLPQVRLERPRLVAKALDRAEAGTDFGDALHLGAADDCRAFLTFDRRLIRAARTAGSRVEEP